VETRVNRRRYKRYPAQWKAAVVFRKADQKPVLHTSTLDLSVGGAAILSEDGNLTGAVVTVLIARPLREGWDAPKTMKALAEVVSTVKLGSPSRFRHGIRFLRGEQLETLEQLLAASAVRDTAASLQAQSQPAPAVGGRLAQLRQLAEAKRATESAPDPQDAIDQRISNALQRAYQYLKDLVEQLDVVKPAFPKGYTITGVPEFDGLAWDYGRADFRARELSPGSKRYEQVTLHFRLSRDKQIRVTREAPASDRLTQQLRDNKIEYEVYESRNEKGVLDKTTFAFACRVRAWLVLEGDFKAGRIKLSTRNVERFGISEHEFEPDDVTETALDELTAFILGESPPIGRLRTRSR
jgi:hypothetical protein